ncbi:hypothetical protein ACFV4P_28365 [Kitasatospora sp. NPDC059795]|uniref:hypothetical protein n=1 Tax=unclassified Kitasatospora TaxID=2633591 RepID=UPI00093B6BD8|nr:hypothetical protein [Kitasatospora sp. CB01950]OKJ13838.1 hypothetical protein AMK19_10625 [Kitasatospora sp. CB01950]
MDETPQGGAGGVPTPEQDRAEQREAHRAEGRPPTVGHDWPNSEDVPVNDVREVPREAHRAEGRPPTVAHDWPSEEKHRRR